MRCQDTNTTKSGCQPLVTVCFSLIRHNAVPSFHLPPGCSEQVNSHLPILFWHLQRTQSDSGSSIHVPAPPALCLSSVQKQEQEKSITEGYQRAEIIIICIISEFGWQPSPDPSLPGSNKYLCKERSLKRTTTKHRMNAIKKTRRLVNISLIPLEWVGKVKGSLKNRKEKAWQRCEGEPCLGSGQGHNIRQGYVGHTPHPVCASLCF